MDLLTPNKMFRTVRRNGAISLFGTRDIVEFKEINPVNLRLKQKLFSQFQFCVVTLTVGHPYIRVATLPEK